MLGLTSVYREGFETVLFLQSLELSAGTVTVLEGAGLGLALTLLVAVLTFALQRKLPYKKMLIVTGVLIAFVLVVMVGQTARTMQGTGWLPITPAPVEVPYWAGCGSASSRRGRRWARRWSRWRSSSALRARAGGQGQAPAAPGRAPRGAAIRSRAGVGAGGARDKTLTR